MTVWIDENLSPKLAKGLNELVDYDVRYIPDIFGKGILDKDWIPKVKDNIVITADYKMRLVTAERNLIEQNNIGLFLIKPPSRKGLGLWDQVKLVINCWESIDKAINKEPRPFIFKLLGKGQKSKDKTKRKYNCLEQL